MMVLLAKATDRELARLGRVIRARVTQIMNLLSVAPDIQEAILFVKPAMGGRDWISERSLRPLATVIDWQTQHQKWSSIVPAEN